MTTEPPSEPDLRLDLLLDSILAAHGEALDDAQRILLRQQVQRLRASVATLDAYPLRNANEPDFRFAAVDRTDTP